MNFLVKSSCADECKPLVCLSSDPFIFSCKLFVSFLFYFTFNVEIKYCVVNRRGGGVNSARGEGRREVNWGCHAVSDLHMLWILRGSISFHLSSNHLAWSSLWFLFGLHSSSSSDWDVYNSAVFNPLRRLKGAALFFLFFFFLFLANGTETTDFNGRCPGLSRSGAIASRADCHTGSLAEP